MTWFQFGVIAAVDILMSVIFSQEVTFTDNGVTFTNAHNSAAAFTLTLREGASFHFEDAQDLTGTTIQAAGPFALFAGVQ